jgi:hypothetical protein
MLPPDVHDIVVVKDFVLPAQLTVCSALSSDHLRILIDTTCRSSFQNLPDHPVHANGVGCIPGLPWWQTPGKSRGKRRGGNRQVRGRADQRHPRGHSGICSQAPTPYRPAAPLPASIQYEISLKKRFRRQWQVTRDPALKAQVNRLQRSVTYRLNEWRNEQWSDALESLDSEDQSLWKMTKRVVRVPTSSPPFPEMLFVRRNGQTWQGTMSRTCALALS